MSSAQGDSGGFSDGRILAILAVAAICVGFAIYFLVSYARGTDDYAWTKQSTGTGAKLAEHSSTRRRKSRRTS